MKKYILTTLGISLFSLILCISCSKPTTFIPLESDYTNYYCFAKKGSYWVYTDDNGSIYDSLFCNNYQETKQFVDSKSKGNAYQTFTQFFSSQKNIAFFSQLRQHLGKTYLQLSKYNNDDYDLSFGIECKPINIANTDSNYLFHSQYNNGFKTFNDVIEIEHKYFYAKKIGLIKIISSSNKVYHLTNYKIN